nr:hypothetical protein Iba_chr01eCG7210 [Ipomoea batatas]
MKAIFAGVFRPAVGTMDALRISSASFKPCIAAVGASTRSFNPARSGAAVACDGDGGSGRVPVSSGAGGIWEYWIGSGIVEPSRQQPKENVASEPVEKLRDSKGNEDQKGLFLWVASQWRLLLRLICQGDFDGVLGSGGREEDGGGDLEEETGRGMGRIRPPEKSSSAEEEV